MFGEVERVKERRRQRLEKIRIQARDSMSPYVNDWKDPLDENPGGHGSSYPPAGDGTNRMPTLPVQEKLGIQTFFSLLLIGASYLLFQSGVALPAAWKESAREVMTRDFNFSGVADWYEARFGSFPSVLPVFTPKKTAVPASTANETQVWKLPESWKAADAFDPLTGRITFSIGEDAMVRNSGETGWVSYVGEKPGYGLMVAVRYPKGREIWYGNLEKAEVQENDVVYGGDLLGKAKETSSTAHQVILSVKEKETFVNPLDVIRVD